MATGAETGVGTTSQGMPECGMGEEQVLPETPEGARRCQHLDFSPGKPMSGSGLKHCKRITLLEKGVIKRKTFRVRLSYT